MQFRKADSYPRNLAGERCLVTGGGSGIGRGIALALARRGAAVALAGRRGALLEQVAQAVRAAGGTAAIVVADIADPAQRARLVEVAATALGGIDVLINNAGVLASGALFQLTGDEIERAIATNLAAPIDLTRLAVPYLAQTGGAVVLVGSTMSHVPLPYAAVYSASKSGLRAFGESVRHELGALGVHVLTVYPPTVDTAMTKAMAARAGRWQPPRASAEDVGERIVQALEKGECETLWGTGERFLARLHALAPRVTQGALGSQRRRFANIMTPTPAPLNHPVPSGQAGTTALHQQWQHCLAAYPVRSTVCQGHTWRLIDTGDPPGNCQPGNCQPPLLLLPGALGRPDTSFQYLLAFAPERRVVALDYPDDISSAAALVAGIAALQKELDAGPTDLVGGSFSGLVAQLLAAQHPQRVRSLLLSNTSAPEPAHALGWRAGAALLARLPMPWLLQRMQAAVPRFLPDDTEEQRFWRDYFAAMLPTWPQVALVARARILADLHSKGDASHIHAHAWRGPVLIVDAAADRLTTARQRHALHNLYPQAQIASLGDKGHVASLDAATSYIGLYREFLCSLPAYP